VGAYGIVMAIKSTLIERQVRQSQARLTDLGELAQALIRSAGTGIYISQERKFQYANYLFQELTGYTEEELLNTDPLSLVHPEDREEVRKKAIENLKGRQSLLPYEYRLIKRNGDIMWVLERVTYIEYGGKRAAVGSFMDITDRKHAEDELKQSLKRLRQAMEGAIQALALIVESRDPYTAGHQRRVTKLACAIAKEMGFSQNQIDAVRMAAATHDIGKVHVPAEILSKPGKLAEIEASIIKTHPKVGYEILSEIEFPFPVAKIVLQHHERMDGSGYPQGLLGDDILLEARILGVADVVEAMASHRPYRPAIGVDRALEEISNNKGKLYDAGVVDACLRLFAEKGFKLD
jgi:PAS domain S-box-containing protein/putative nucleotidyltransferase with HDIG domain